MVAGIKVSQLPPVTGENAQTNDLFVLARESSSENFKFSRGELFSSTPPISVSGDIAVTGTVDGRDVAFDGELFDGFETRAELVTWWATNNSSAPDGFVVSVGSLRWVKDGGGTSVAADGLSLSSDGPVHMLVAGAGNTHGLLFVSDVASGGTTALSSSEVTNATVIQIPFQYPVYSLPLQAVASVIHCDMQT